MRIALLALAAGLAGCAGAEAAMVAAQPPALAAGAPDELGFHAGETMAFELQLGGVLLGEAQLAVGELGEVDGRRAIVVRSRAATAGAASLLGKVSDEATSVIDADTGRPISLATVFLKGDRRTEASATFDGGVAEMTIQRHGEPAPRKHRITAQAHALHEAHSAIAQVRGWRAAPGAVRTVLVIGGRRMWRVDMKHVGVDTVGSALGNRRALVYDGTAFRARADLAPESGRPARTFRVWLSDDADRVPLRVSAKTEFGAIELTLTDYARP